MPSTSSATEDRVRDLLGRMTLDEKLAQLGSVWAFELLDHSAFDPDRARARMASGIGQITRIAGSTNLRPRDVADLANRIQRFLLEETRLGIPAIVHEESLHGILGRDRVCFPQSIGLAATWDPELVGRMADRIGRALRAGGAQQSLAPILDVSRDPRWGRIEETFGEDPYLVAALGISYIRGLQGEAGSPGAIIATGKHMVGHGVPEGGLNHAPVHLGPRELRDVFLFPFEAAVRTAGLRAMMHAYDDLDGIPCVASRELLTTILRDEWGFDGVVVSDYFAIEWLISSHRLVDNLADAAALALDAGVDVELPSTAAYGQPLADAIADGRVELAMIETAVARVLREKFALGLFEHPYVELAADLGVAGVDEDRRLARELATRSIVLLKNDGILPLAAGVGAIAVIGPNADSARNLLGDYSHVAHVESLIEMRERQNITGAEIPADLDAAGLLDGQPTILDAIRDAVGRDTDVRYAAGSGLLDGDDAQIADAVAVATGADVAIVVVGERSGLTSDSTSGEARDRLDIGLPGRQADLVAAVAATGTPVVLVLVAGRPLSVESAAAQSAAVLHAWVPGQEGPAAIAETLFGTATPGGKLPVTVPRHVGQVPIYYAHKPSGGKSNWKVDYVDGSHLPLWPFGFGLSYTSFAIGNLQVDRRTVSVGDELSVRVDVENTGTRAGDEVVQLYARDMEASVTRPVIELCGFRRVHLEPGAQRQVTFRLAAEQFAFTGVDGRLVLEPGRIELSVGSSSVDLPCRVEIEITGEPMQISRSRYLSDVSES